MRRTRLAMAAVVAALAVLVSTTFAEEPKKLKYPDTKKGAVVDDYHGTKVADPYRWLEDDVRKSKDVAEWVEAQNKVTFGFLESIPEREPIKKRITDLWNYEKISAPFKINNRYFFFKNDGLQNQNVLFVQDSLDGEAKMLMDPNAWTKDGTVALAGLEVSDDAKFIAYGTAEAGSDWNVCEV
jgi:prolyl oligopeptidase